MSTASFFSFSFVFCEEDGGGHTSLVTSHGIPPPRDADVIHILVRHQEVRKKATETRKAEVSLTSFALFNYSFGDCP